MKSGLRTGLILGGMMLTVVGTRMGTEAGGPDWTTAYGWRGSRGSGGDARQGPDGPGADGAVREVARGDSPHAICSGQTAAIGGEDLVDVLADAGGVGRPGDVSHAGWDDRACDRLPARSEGCALEGEAARDCGGERAWVDKFGWYAFYSGMEFAKAGAVVVTYDMIGEGERNIDRKSRASSHDKQVVPPAGLPSTDWGQRLAGLMQVDLMQGVTYLTEQPEVDSKRIAVLGYSMGSFVAGITGAIDTRIHAVLLSGAGVFDGPGGYFDSGNLPCQGAALPRAGEDRRSHCDPVRLECAARADVRDERRGRHGDGYSAPSPGLVRPGEGAGDCGARDGQGYVYDGLLSRHQPSAVVGEPRRGGMAGAADSLWLVEPKNRSRRCRRRTSAPGRRRMASI